MQCVHNRNSPKANKLFILTVQRSLGNFIKYETETTLKNIDIKNNKELQLGKRRSSECKDKEKQKYNLSFRHRSIPRSIVMYM